jgi:hypothetical protein
VPENKRQRGNKRPDLAHRRRSRSSRIGPSSSQRRAADQRLAWYAGLALMAVFELVDWPVALIIAFGHEMAHRARTQALRELAEGIEAGA